MSSIRSSFNKASSYYDDNAFLQQEIATRLDSKLSVISSSSDVILDLGAGTGALSKKISKRFINTQLICLDFAQNSLKQNQEQYKVCADARYLPLADKSVDIVISNLMMQWCVDLDQLFLECFRVLKNGGLMLFSTFGPDTLKELKKSWAVVDDKSHVNTFVDMHNIGDKLLKNGFESPIMEMENVILTYQTVIDLLLDIKAIGAQSISSRVKTLTGKHKFKLMTTMYESYRQNGKLPATYEVIYGHAWKKCNKLNKIDCLSM